MTQMENDDYLNITEKIVKKASEYNRNTKEKHFSGSMFGNNHLQNYLIIIDQRDLNTEYFEVGQNSIGSVFHKGMEESLMNMKEPANIRISSEHQVLRELPNGWTLTGTIDRIDTLKNENRVNIHDYKLTKIYKGKMLKKDIASGILTDGYILQLNSYMYSLQSSCSSFLFLDMFYKDANPLKDEKAYEQINVPHIEGFEDMAVKITDELEAFLNSGTTPPECDDLWWRKNAAKESIPTRCELYCGVKDICPYYSARYKSTPSVATTTWD